MEDGSLSSDGVGHNGRMSLGKTDRFPHSPGLDWGLEVDLVHRVQIALLFL